MFKPDQFSGIIKQQSKTKIQTLMPQTLISKGPMVHSDILNEKIVIGGNRSGSISHELQNKLIFPSNENLWQENMAVKK
jgi:hypothetical protein